MKNMKEAGGSEAFKSILSKTNFDSVCTLVLRSKKFILDKRKVQDLVSILGFKFGFYFNAIGLGTRLGLGFWTHAAQCKFMLHLFLQNY